MFQLFKRFTTRRYLKKNLAVFTEALTGAHGKKQTYRASEVLDVLNGLGIKQRYFVYFLAHFCSKDEYLAALNKLSDSSSMFSSDVMLHDYYAFTLETIMIDHVFSDIAQSDNANTSGHFGGGDVDAGGGGE